MSNQQVGYTLQINLAKGFSNFVSDLLQDCDMHEDSTALPMKFNSPPVYGSEDATFNEFMAPGMIIMIVFFLAICLTGEAFISEKEVIFYMSINSVLISRLFFRMAC